MVREVKFDWKNSTFSVGMTEGQIASPEIIAQRLFCLGLNELYEPFFDQSDRPIITNHADAVREVFGAQTQVERMVETAKAGKDDILNLLGRVPKAHQIEFLEQLLETGRPFTIGQRKIISQYLELKGEVDSNRLEYEQRLTQTATRDDLTGLLNRNTATELMTSAMQLAERQRLPVAVGMFDLDNFKLYNDTQGHPAGDEVLKAFAEILSSQFRGYDVAARFGGEEFFVLAYGMPSEVLGERLQSFSRSLYHRSLELNPKRAVTFSSGFVHGPHYDDLPGLISGADKLLYQVKEEDGRDGVRIATPNKTEVIRFGNI
jgi:diguanylate cyclase (GGDEF)-like protein